MCSVNYQEEYERGRNYVAPSPTAANSGSRERIEGAADTTGYNAEGTEEDERPDFSKYFTGGSAPAVAGASSSSETSESGFVAPIDFGQFFQGSLFGKK